MRARLRPAMLLLAAFVAAGCRPAAAVPRPAAAPPCEPVTRPDAVCSADGVVAVRAVDERRVLVAVDARGAGVEPDGLADHLYLYTSERPHGLFVADTTFDGHVEYREGELLVVGAGGQPRLEFAVRRRGGSGAAGPPTVRLEGAVGLSHYSRQRGPRLARLRALRVAPDCDGPAGSCLELDGLRIRFPA